MRHKNPAVLAAAIHLELYPSDNAEANGDLWPGV
jgi:hypothetical protein